MVEDVANAAEAGSLIRELRRHFGMTGREFGRRVGISQSKLSRMENGLGPIGAADIAAIAAACGSDDIVAAQIIERMQATRQESQRASRSELNSTKSFAELEKCAVHTRVCVPMVIPALLQTEAYATAIIATYAKWPSTERQTSAVVDRLVRQAYLRDPARSYKFLIGHQSLTHRFTDVDQHLAQLHALLAHMDRPNVAVACIPPRHRLPSVPDSHYTIFDDSAVAVDSPASIRLSERESDVCYHAEQFEQLWKCAMRGDELRALVLDEVAALTHSLIVV